METTALKNVRLSALYSCYLNCPILVGSGSHNGSIQAFLTRWLGKREKLSALSLSVHSLPLSLSFSLICCSYFFFFLFAEWSLRIGGVVSKSSSRLLSPHWACSHWPKGALEHLSLSLRPQLEPMYHAARHHNTVEWAHGQLLFVCTIYVNVQSAANGTIMQSFIPAILRSRPLG